ncbi:hypothetical protein DL765_006245 [Monosporascus sp. GIB2]|nr:hypothetical protein DL765_006245 [Monosporascus sp. GIB2]
MAALCGVCRSFDFAATSKSDTSGYFSVSEGYPRGHDIYFYSVRDGRDDDIDISNLDRMLTLYHKHIQSLATAAASCHVCSLVLESVQQVLDATARAREKGYDYPESGYEFWICGRGGPRGRGSGFKVVGINPKYNMKRREGVLMAAIEFRVEEGTDLAERVIGRPITESSRDPRVVQKLKEWVQECSSDHVHATMEPSAPLPTRVLRISEDASMVSLETSEGVHGEYAALSHCWGSSQPITLTSDNHQELHRGVKTSDLPQTFRDAVWMTHALGIRWLWIDSLCIRQDDLEDWRRESAKMHTVYRNSIVSLAATRAADSSEGFLGPREQPRFALVPYRTTSESGEGLITSEVQAYASPLRHEAFPTTETEFDKEPLSARGWALQERFLSVRMLHFTRTQIYLECEREIFSEDNRRDMYNAVKAGEPAMYSHFLDSYLFKHRWQRLCSLYSNRSLTVPSDKLPAMAGMAAHFAWSSEQEKVGHEMEMSPMKPRCYLAGIWLREDSVDQLCWSLDDGLGAGARPPEYRAPTWSWAALDGPIRWEEVPIELATVKGAHVEPQSPEHIFGQVSGGWLCLRAITFKPYRIPDDEASKDIMWIKADDIMMYLYPSWDAEPYKIAGKGQLPSADAGETDVTAVVMGCLLLFDGTPFALFVVLVKPLTAQEPGHSKTPVFERVGSGAAMSTGRQNQSTGRTFSDFVNDELKVKKEKGELNELIIL